MKRRRPRLAECTLPIMQETAAESRRLLGLHSTRNRELQNVLLSDPAAAIAVFRELHRARPGAGCAPDLCSAAPPRTACATR